MLEESFHILEYEAIREKLAAFASSSPGKELARMLTPSSEAEVVRDRMAETEESVRIFAIASPPLGGFMDIRPALKTVEKGASLDLPAMTDIMSTLYAMRNVKQFFKESEVEAPVLKERAHSIEILGQLERLLENTIDEHGRLRDDASVELRRIKQGISSVQSRIKERIGSILHAPQYQKFFQDMIVSVRDERYVIPVKAEYRPQFPGIVHDQSATGSTLFIEPMAVVELNNDVKQLMLQEQQEIRRILRHLTSEVKKNTGVLGENLAILASIDFAFAKARLADAMGATLPHLNEDGRTKLLGARHPLIDAEEVIPIDIEIGEKNRMLLVTGPNTGGKTVSMKTFGLLALMAQSGCYLPVEADSEISIFQNIYADIGDEQSIEQSLSTFSAHMTHLVEILKRVDRNDLLLLDEIGAGTDPEEGAALAMAILERLLEIGIVTMATTHYSELKTFAFTHDGIENACVEFDIETLRPTYRLLIGMPGASNAFAISSRLGLSDALILRAKQLIEADHAQFEHVINELEHEKRMFEERNADIAERQRRIEQLEQKVNRMREELSEKKGKMIKKARDESAALVRRTRRESENIIKKLKEQFDDQGIQARQKAMQEARRRLAEAAARTRSGIMGQKGVGKPIDLKTIACGDIVYVKRLDQRGTVTAIKGKDVEVAIGSLHMKLHARECTFLGHAAKAQDSSKMQNIGGRGKRSSESFLQKTQAIGREIDIRGMMVDEAEIALGKFIDDAVMAGLSQILVIHGKGTGALRKGVHSYLKRHRNIESFAFADMGEGGTGATVISLK